jgi:Kef-type K+ transport system membrane component KefB
MNPEPLKSQPTRSGVDLTDDRRKKWNSQPEQQQADHAKEFGMKYREYGRFVVQAIILVLILGLTTYALIDPATRKVVRNEPLLAMASTMLAAILIVFVRRRRWTARRLRKFLYHHGEVSVLAGFLLALMLVGVHLAGQGA